MIRTIVFFVLVYSLSPVLKAQESEDNSVLEEREEFRIDLEFRPRTEFRNGYRKLRSDTTNPAFFTEQRSRLYFNYQREGFIFHTSIQDIRVWGEDDPRSTNGTLQVFEVYVEPKLSESLSVRVGRQKIMYDNQRLFAQNDWRQTGGSHDAVRFIYSSTKLTGDLIAAYNQEEGAQERFFETDFSPEIFNNYKILLANFWKWTATDRVTFTIINAMDAFQDEVNTRNHHYRFTSGGRLEYEKKSLYFTLAGYYQYGETPSGMILRAYYYQPEVKYQTHKHWTFRLGAEVFSGDNNKNPSNISNSFDALYGVNHRFLGSMDYFTRFPADFNSAGLIAPYFFTFYELNKEVLLRADFHLFFSQNNYVQDGRVIDNYLGFENDLLLRFTPNEYSVFDLGYSYALPTSSMEVIKNGGDNSLLQSWAFVMLTFKPNLFQWNRTISK